jgi:WD40 repeat protein
MIVRKYLALWIVGLRAATESFLLESSSQKNILQRYHPAVVRSSSLYDDFEELEESSSSSSNNNSRKNDRNINADAAIYAALKARQASIQQSSSTSNTPKSGSGPSSSSQQNSLEDPFLVSWLEASTVPAVRITLDDWIRRMAIHTYPLMVCGSASGNMYLVDLQRGEELDCLLQLHAARCVGDRHREALQHLYGRFDGGGVVAIAMKDDMIASAGREGGVHICTLVGQEQRISKGSRGGATRHAKLKLQRQGKIRGLELEDEEEDSLVTSLVFDEYGTLWIAGYDGILRGYDSEVLDADNRPLMLRQKHPIYELDLESPILHLAVNDEIGCGVAATVREGIVLFSLEDGEIIGGWNPFVSSARDEFARSALIFQSDPEGVWSVVIGGSRGSLFQRQLNVDRFGTVSSNHPFRDQVDEATFPLKMLPAHSGAVLAMDSPLPGILVTGAQDGTMRVWDCSPDDDEEDVEGEEEAEANYDDVQWNDSRPRCLYALSGYKVWLGSIFSSSRKLVSDGADNTIIVHSFDEEEEDILFKEDDDDDFEGFNFE